MDLKYLSLKIILKMDNECGVKIAGSKRDYHKKKTPKGKLQAPTKR